MRVLEKKIIYSPDLPYDKPYEEKVGEADILKIQISGNDICSIKIYGRLSPYMEEQELSAIKDNDYSVVNTITTSGIYTVSCEGYNEIKIDVITPGDGMSCYVVRGGCSNG